MDLPATRPLLLCVLMMASGLLAQHKRQPHQSQPQRDKPEPSAATANPNATAARATHDPHPRLPPLFAWKFVKLGNEAFVAARKHAATQRTNERAQPKLLPRPAGGGRYVCAVVACADTNANIPALLGLRQRDVLVIRTPGPFVSPETVAMLARSVQRHRLSLILLLSHDRCDALTPPRPAKAATQTARDDVLDRRRRTIERLAQRQRCRLRDALLTRQRELLLASSNELWQAHRGDRLRILPGVIDTRSGKIDWRQRKVQELPMSPVK